MPDVRRTYFSSSRSGIDIVLPNVDLLRRLTDADVVAERLRHLLRAVEALQQREDRDVLRLLSVSLLDVAAEKQVEELVGAAYLDVGPHRYRVVRLIERIEDLVRADCRAFLQALGEILALQHLLQRRLAEQPQHVGGAQLGEPLRVAVHLGPVAIKHQEDLVEVGLRVGVDLFAR